MKMRVALLAVFAALVLIGLPGSSTPQDKPDAKPQKKAAFPDLLAGLRATPGCLGVETAKTASGKEVIFAWFEDKKAVLKWYNSEMHKEVMKKFFPDGGYSKPLRDVPDDSGPIMAIASITFTDKPKFKETPLPISQIAIELYTPLSGGIFLGGRFAPDKLKVPKMRDYTPEKK